MRRFGLILIAAAMHTLLACGIATAKPTISLDLSTEKGFPITGSKDWYDLLTSLGVNQLTIHSSDARTEVGAEETGSKKSPNYRVTGILSADNILHLPGGKFSLRNRAEIKKWLDNLADQGIAGVVQERAAFGLLPGQLVDVNTDLSQPIRFSTMGISSRAMLDECGKKLKFALQFDADVSRAPGV